MSALAIKPTAHVVDVLGNVIGRDQPILRMEKALEMVALLGEAVFADENVVFFDPFCKAGELLLACAFHSCWAKSKGKAKLLDVDMVMKEIYQSNRYFGLAPDERHHRLSIRTFLGNEHSHNENFNHIIRDGHYLSEEDGKLDREKFEREFNFMIEYINSKGKNKKIIAVGNPPYQENDGGGNAGSATPIYNFFVDASINSNEILEFVFVIPSRWFAGGRNLDEFRENLVQSNNIKAIRYFEKAEQVFPTVQIKGGICFLHWDANHNDLPTFIDDNSKYQLDLTKFDVIPDDPLSFSILEKIVEQDGLLFTSELSLRGKPFGLRTFYFKRNDGSSADDPSAVKCYSTGRKINYVPRSEVSSNEDKIDKYKIAVPATYGKGMRRCTMPVNQYFLVGKGEIVTETYTIVAWFNTKSEAEIYLKYLQTDFARYLLGLRKLTGRVTKETWSWVPLLKLKSDFTEKDLYEQFGLTKKEQEHIKKKVQEWS